MTLRVLMLHWRVSRCESESLLLWILRLDMKVQRVDIALIYYAAVSVAVDLAISSSFLSLT